MLTKSALIKGELIGVFVDVVGKNVSGTIINETKNTVIIRTTKHTQKTVEKSTNTFRFGDGDESITIPGDIFIGRPEDRIKKKVAQ